MLFNSFEFFLFFPVVTILFFLLPHKYRWFHLLVASCFFYASFIPIYLAILFGTIIIDYWAGIYIEKSFGKKRKIYLIISLIANIGILAVFKYYNFFIDNINQLVPFGYQLNLLKIALPIGLSFHTFQAMSYTIEVYRGNQKAERHFGIYSLYVLFYPQMVAGPIERPQNIIHQFYEKKEFNYDRVVSGLKLMAWGFLKKILIADRIAGYSNHIFQHSSEVNSSAMLIGVFFFAIQIYCDFSGYSDIARGCARVMGYELMLNFRTPYFAKSISEFWKRWHISLSTWFKDYLYIPLGGNRVSIPRHYFNLFFTFMISGFWHGANWTFVIWGALHGIYLIIESATKNLRNSLFAKAGVRNSLILNIGGTIFTFTLVCLSWIYFRADNIQEANFMLGSIFKGFLSFDIFKASFEDILLITPKAEFLTNFILIGGLFFLEGLSAKHNLSALLKSRPRFVRYVAYATICLLILFLGKFGSQEFIYFQF